MSEHIRREGFRALAQTEITIFAASFIIFWVLALLAWAVFGPAAPRPVLPLLGLTVIHSLFVVSSYLYAGLSIYAHALLHAWVDKKGPACGKKDTAELRALSVCRVLAEMAFIHL
jgi:hypothetical protein